MGGLASSVSDTTISILVERENLFRVLGDEDMPENYNFGGISGGPVIAIVQTPTIRAWMPAGVIFQGPNATGDETNSIAGLEIIKARRNGAYATGCRSNAYRWSGDERPPRKLDIVL